MALEDDLEVVRVFGLMAFGAGADAWDDEVFFHRTGIALDFYKKGVRI